MKKLYVNNNVYELAKKAGYRESTIPIYQELRDWLREEHYIDINILVDCSVNEILGYKGILHFIMAKENPYETIEDDGNYYEVLDKTLTRALEILIKRNEESQTI